MAVEKPMWWQIDYTTENDGNKKNSPIKGPAGLILHSTAWPGKDAKGIQAYFNSSARNASIHGALDNNMFIQTMPFTQRAGHVGSGVKGSLNGTFLGIETCEPSGEKYNGNTSAIIAYNPPAGYFQELKQKAIHLYAYLCHEFGINPLQHNASGGILGHYEAALLGVGSNHGDPRHWWEKWEHYTMEDFRRDVAKYMQQGNVKTETMRGGIENGI